MKNSDEDLKTLAKLMRGIVKFIALVVGGLLLSALLVTIIGAIGYVIYKYMTLVHVLLVIIATLLVALGAAGYYLYRFANIIMVFEDDLSETIESLNECEDSLQNVTSLRLFFENEQIRPILEAAKDEVVMCRMKVRQMAERFVERSNQKYVVYEEPIEVEKIRGIPGAIDDDFMERTIKGYRQELGDDEDVMFVSQEEMNASRRARRYKNN